MKIFFMLLVSVLLSACNCNREAAQSTATPAAPAAHDPHEHHGAGTFENKQVQIPMPADPSKPVPTDGPCVADTKRVGFLTPFPVNGFPCAAETQVCDGTKWVGSPLYAKCDPNGGPNSKPKK